jgi:uncharacterized membrane protein YtjA (UPF0391 family)
MATERLNIPVVPEFGDLAVGKLAVGLIRTPCGTRRRLWSFDATAQRQETIMLNWAIAFLIIALIAGLLGFGVIAGTAFAAAKVIFVIALLAFLVSGVVEVSRRGVR